MQGKGAPAEAGATGTSTWLLVAAATAAAATSTSPREPGGLRRCAVAGGIRPAENGKLEGVLLPRALRAGNLLRLVQHDLFKVRLAVLANVFVNRHRSYPGQISLSKTLQS
jgi:hypothetical protein